MKEKTISFFQSVYEVVVLIPYGRVTTYGAIGNYLGMKSSARMVGWAMNACHSNKNIPAHRVVNSSGLLTGKHHFGHPKEMEELLQKEGIEIENGIKIIRFKDAFWDPSEELL
ncbi:MGMT family protein [uncultured Cytophaga sp.]|uniref:MGMT family protein n=1 Tax=uncultured Cytophaga sp. TaxID=160238 RepID=UPI00262220F7|nr:MGMT family protein [uncultured Cytophaga sp.]